MSDFKVVYAGIQNPSIGDTVRYTGRLSGGKPVDECVIIKLMGPDSVFNQQMAIVTDVNHWVAVRELEAIDGIK